MQNLSGAKSSGNPREMFAKIPGLNIWESDGAGIQIGIGGRGFINKNWFGPVAGITSANIARVFIAAAIIGIAIISSVGIAIVSSTSIAIICIVVGIAGICVAADIWARVVGVATWAATSAAGQQADK